MKRTKIKKNISIVLLLFIVILQFPMVSQAASTHKSQEYANLVIFAQFADTQGNFMSNTDDVKKIVRNYQDESFPKSLVSYMSAVSYGQMHINSYLPQYNADSTSVIPVVLPKNRSTYSGEASDYLALRDALNAFANQCNVSGLDLDQNKDGYIDNVTFIFEGEEGARASVFYPHKEDCAGLGLNINGKSINTVNVLNSESLLDVNSINSYGVISHEFLHSLGYPDLYTEAGSSTPVGQWDLMASSSNFMQYPLAYLRSSVSGWLDISEVTSNSHLTLQSASSETGNEAYILKSPLSSTEFFVIEYRKQGTKYSNELDVKIPGTGLIIYRINTKSEELSNHHGLPYGVYVFRQGETTINGATAGNMSKSYFSKESGRTSFGSTDLNASIKDNALVFSDGTNSGIKIANIGSAGDTISCDVSFADYASANMWNTIADTNTFASNHSSVASIDIDNMGNPFVLYSSMDEYGIDESLGVKKYVDGQWQSVGGLLQNYYYSGKIALYNNIPYVLFQMKDAGSSNGLAMGLYRYNQGNWQQVESWRPASGEDILDCTMMKGSDGLYLSYLQGTNSTGYSLKLLKVDSNNNLATLSANIATDALANIDMAVDGNRVYISARNSANYAANYPQIWCYSNGQIVEIPQSEVIGDSAPKIAASNQMLYLLADSTTGVKIYQYTAQNGWSQIKKSDTENGAITSIQSSSSDIAIIDGVPVVQVLNQGTSGNDGENTTQVWRYRNDTWVKEGNNIDAGLSNDNQLAIFNNRVYVAYLSEVGEFEKYTMVKNKELQLTSSDVPSGAVCLTGITVDPPTRTEYKVGQRLDTSGMTVTGMYSDMTHNIIPINSCAISGFDSSKVGKQTVKVSYGGYSEEFQVTVIASDGQNDNEPEEDKQSYIYNGIDYSAVFNPTYYANHNQDLKNAFNNDVSALLTHFVNYGMNEGRQGKVNFNLQSYRNAYADLRNAFGSDKKSYYLHYINYGIHEGRIGTGYETKLMNPVTVYQGVDYSAVYDYVFYTKTYGDIARAFPYDDASTLSHFVNCGMYEGRQGKATFNVQSYKNAYVDLRNAFGNNTRQYYLHYITNGRKEGRVGVGYENQILGAKTIYNGVDYSSIYDYNYYVTRYPDIKAAFGFNDQAVLNHFVNCGMKEGRQGNGSFSAQIYRNRYGDLRNAFGNNWQSYYLHYLSFGRREGRSGK